jgi:DNA-binding CsgD family transcriptional regulator
MDLARPVECPILLGRDGLLAIAEDRLRGVSKGGGMLLLAGEPGIGKTRLASAIGRKAETLGFRLAGGAVAPQDLQVPAALFLDLARTAARRPGFVELGPCLLELLRDVPATSRSSPRQRRRLVVFDAVGLLADAADAPTLLVFEDLQWADELSLEILGELARRSRDLPLLVVATYRTTPEVGGSALGEWRARLMTQRLAGELRLEPLSMDQTADMTRLILGGDLPASRELVAAVYERSDGIPLHVEELIGMAASGGRLDEDGIRNATVPNTIEDAIRHRLGQRSSFAQRLAQAGAVLGRSFLPGVVAAVMEVPVEELDEPLQELVDHAFLGPRGPGGSYDFRNQLLRDALYNRIPEAQRRRLHERVAEIGAQLEGASPIHASVHFERAGNRAEAFRTALVGASAAAAVSSHREALDLYRRVTRNMPVETDPMTQARILEELATEAAAMDQNEAAAAAFESARELYLRAGAALHAAAIMAPLVSIRHLLGVGTAAGCRLLERGLEELDQIPEEPDRTRVRASLVAALASALARDLRIAEAERCALEAIGLARTARAEAIELNARGSLAGALMFAGRLDEGMAAGIDVIARAGELHLDEEVARACRLLGSDASEILELGVAERWLREGVEIAERSQLWNHRNYMNAHLGLVLWDTGHWDEAQEVAERALSDGRGGVTTRITAMYVKGYVALGRGDWAVARANLDESLSLGSAMGDILRVSLPLWGLAENALLEGDPARAVELTERARQESARVDDAALLSPFLVTGTRARLAVGDPAGAERWASDVGTIVGSRRIPGIQPAVHHARGLVLLSRGSVERARSELEAARRGWDAVGRVWEGAWARTDLAMSLMRTRRYVDAAQLLADVRATANGLRSRPLAAKVEELARAIRGRHSEAESWHPLTAREFEVARLIATGLTNAEIAAELSVAPRTVSAHVEHVLAKLGAARRTEIASWVATAARARAGDGHLDVPKPAPAGDQL